MTEEVKAKRERSKAVTKIQKKVNPTDLGLPADVEVFVTIPTAEPINSTVKAVSLLRKVEKKPGDEYQIIGVKKVFKTSTKEIVDVIES